MKTTDAQIEFDENNVPVSLRYDDPYFSKRDGLAESRYVFLGGNDLPARFCDGFHIGELGFGTGLNFLVSLAAWRACARPGRFYFTSFEAFPIDASTRRRALDAFPEIAPLVQEFITGFDGQGFHAPDVVLRVIVGDARETLPSWAGMADAWFLDGFSPAKNPELWEPSLMQAVAAKTAAGGTLATYSAAGHVRKSLEGAGFSIERVKGFAHKRHMVRGALGGD